MLGGGCFWCLDATYRLVKGIEKVVSGYAGGSLDNPSYEQVSTGRSGHAEVVELTFNPHAIALRDILSIFWAIHDPTTPNRQGNDVGPQYRSVIFYVNGLQLPIIEQSLAKAQKLWPNPIVTEVKLLEIFYPAEDYHQDYFTKNPSEGYCQVIINPKLTKLRQHFSAYLK